MSKLQTISEYIRRGHGGGQSQIAELRKAFKRPRPDRFCPRCKSKTEVDGDGVTRCVCGWHSGMTLVLPSKPTIVNPAAELAGK